MIERITNDRNTRAGGAEINSILDTATEGVGADGERLTVRKINKVVKIVKRVASDGAIDRADPVDGIIRIAGSDGAVKRIARNGDIVAAGFKMNAAVESGEGVAGNNGVLDFPEYGFIAPVKVTAGDAIMAGTRVDGPRGNILEKRIGDRKETQGGEVSADTVGTIRKKTVPHGDGTEAGK